MRLYHTTRRSLCAQIAEHGFTNSRSGTYGGGGVYLSQTIVHRENGSTVGDYEPEHADSLPPELVVFAFDIPDEVAGRFACGGCCYLSPDDPEYDPEIDTPDELLPDGLPPDEWVVPAEIVNRHFACLFHWSGDNPLTELQLQMLRAKTTSTI